MYPERFPNIAPFLRVINPNPSEFTISSQYIHLKSQNDPRSLVINPLLNEIKTWQPHNSVVSILIEVGNLLRNNFPFEPIIPFSINQWNNN
jgi:hypothetical protein